MANSKWRAMLKHVKYNSSSPNTRTQTISLTANSTGADPTEKACQPFENIPGPKGLPFIGSVVDFMKYSRKEPNALHKFIHEESKKYGPIFKLKIGPMAFVILQDPVYIQDALKKEGKYPKRVEFEAWEMYRKDSGRSLALLLSDGEEWQMHRTAMNHHMMRPQNVAMHTDDFTEIAKDFMDYLADELKSSGNGKVDDLRRSLFLWSFESGCSMIYEERLGCLSRDPPEEARMFIDAIQGALATTEKLLFFPPKLAKALKLPMWAVHCKHWDVVFTMGKKLAEKKIERVRSSMASGRVVTGLIASMLQRGSLNEDEITGDIIDLMTAAVDTTSLTILYTLHLLSKHPEKQDKLYLEIAKVRTPDGSVGQDQLRDMTYMKAVIKEVLRLYPVGPFLTRTTEDDTVIGGYTIPQGTVINVPLWSMGRDSSVYRDPETFRPERWLKENQQDSIHPFANLHFGHGARSCIGRRVAELEIYLLLSQLLQKYQIQDGSPGEILDTQATIVLVPKEQMDVVFKARDA